jgi:hypothetical protein
MFIVVPPHVKPFWLKVVARNLSAKHPDIVVVGPVDDRLQGQLQRYHVTIQEPPAVPIKPRTWWGSIRWWWLMRILPEWDPIETCDVVLILWDHSSAAMDAMRKTHVRGKKTWLVRMTNL